MAKKKGTKKKKSTKRTSSKRWWVWWLLAGFLIVGVYLLYQHVLLTRKNPSSGLDMPEVKREQPRPTYVPSEKKPDSAKTKPRPIAKATAESYHSMLRKEHTPRSKSTKGRVVHYQNYAVLFDTLHKVPLWVAYELTYKEARGGVKRKKNFEVDPNLRNVSATNADYSHSGFDRGHLAPAADMAFSQVAMDESFYYTNIAPQNRTFNKGSWKELEEMVRRWAISDSSLFITSGTVVGRQPNYIGKNRIAVPAYFFKAVLSTQNNCPRAIGFVYRNEATSRSPYFYMVSIDSIESLSGLDLYPALPDSVEREVEQSVESGWWKAR